MRDVSKLTKKELVRIVERLQGSVFLDMAFSDGRTDALDGTPRVKPGAEFWNPEKHKDLDAGDFLEAMIFLLEEFNLAPTEVTIL